MPSKIRHRSKRRFKLATMWRCREQFCQLEPRRRAGPRLPGAPHPALFCPRWPAALYCSSYYRRCRCSTVRRSFMDCCHYLPPRRTCGEPELVRIWLVERRRVTQRDRCSQVSSRSLKAPRLIYEVGRRSRTKRMAGGRPIQRTADAAKTVDCFWISCPPMARWLRFAPGTSAHPARSSVPSLYEFST